MQEVFEKFGPRPPRSTCSTPPLRWDLCGREQQLALALGAAPPREWWFPGAGPNLQRRKGQEFHEALLSVTAPYALLLCKVLRDYRKAVLKDVASSNTLTWSNATGLLAQGAAFHGDTTSESESDSSSDA